MRKVYSFVVAMILGVMGFAAQADVNITLNINIVDGINATYFVYGQGATALDLVAGENALTLPSSGGTVQISVEDGAPLIVESYSIGGNSQNMYTHSSCSFWIDEDCDGIVYDVVIRDMTESRTAKVTLETDSPESIYLQYGYTYYTPTIDSEHMELYFDPELESNMTIQREPSGEFYKVLLNEEEVTYDYGYYLYGVQDGDVITVTAAYPVDPKTLKFTYVNDTDCITGITVNGGDLITEDFNEMTVNYGDIITVYADPSVFTYNSLLVNGESYVIYATTYGSSFTIKEDTEITVDAVRKAVYTLTFKTETPSDFTLYYGYSNNGNIIEFVDGEYSTTLTGNQTFQMLTNDGYAIKNITITTDAGEEIAVDNYLTYAYISYYTIYGNATVTIETGDIESTRTATAEVTVDCDNVQVRCGNSYTISLVEGVNEVKFNPSAECDFQFRTLDDSPFISITLNDEVYYPSSSSYYMSDVQNGDKINIVALAPEGDATIKFDMASEEAIEIIASVLVDNEEIEDWQNADGFVIPYGSKITVNIYPNTYKITDFAVNGVDMRDEFYSSYTQYVYEDLTFYINAREWGTGTATFTIADSNMVTIYYFDGQGDQQLYSLQAGSTTIEFIENYAEVVLTPINSLYEILYVEDNLGNTYYASYWYKTCTIDVEDGLIYTVYAREIPYEHMAIAFVGQGSYYYGSLYSSDYEIYFSDIFDYGENANHYEYLGFDCDPREVSFYVQAAALDIYAYCNNVQLENTYDNSNSSYANFQQNLMLEDGTVLKVFLEEPYWADVTISDESSIVESIIVDKITAVADNTFSCLQDTEVEITAPEAKVTVDGVELAGVDGVYTFTVSSEAPQVVVTATSGIESVAADRLGNGNVYNVQGMLLIKAATADQIKALPAGIYVINGEKVRIR
ncbi:MAG: hypothetical protein LUD17_03450 [Bacteroidales bacterium]|nr:hypothetical protein [Bacteroidales bacterium]